MGTSSFQMGWIGWTHKSFAPYYIGKGGKGQGSFPGVEHQIFAGS